MSSVDFGLPELLPSLPALALALDPTGLELASSHTTPPGIGLLPNEDPSILPIADSDPAVELTINSVESPLGQALPASQSDPLTPLNALEPDPLTNPRLNLPAATPGLFTVGASGQVNIEFLFDSGAYRGELGLFSMVGLETLTPGSPEFIAAAVQRSLSNSAQGRVVISTASEGASLNGELGERNYNSGTPLGSKSFTFRPNDTLALLLVPNGSLQTVASNPASEGDLRPLFSFAAANPLNANHYGAMTTNANGLVLATEDIRFDSNSDADFNDVILKIEGVTGQLPALDSLIQSRQTWLSSPLGQNLFSIVPSRPIVDPPSPPNPPLPPANYRSPSTQTLSPSTPASPKPSSLPTARPASPSVAKPFMSEPIRSLPSTKTPSWLALMPLTLATTGFAPTTKPPEPMAVATESPSPPTATSTPSSPSMAPKASPNKTSAVPAPPPSNPG